MKIAIIGSGISGMVAAYKLHQTHEIHVFEANHYIGGHTNTIEINNAEQTLNVDTGFIVFNDWTYPNFLELINQLGVEYQPSNMGFSVHSDVNDLEYSGESLLTLFAQPANLFRLGHYKMLLDILRFNRQSPEVLDQGHSNTSLGEYLKQKRFSQHFINDYIIPMGAAIWSTDSNKMFEFPAKTFVRFFKNHGLLNINNRPQWYVIKNGSKSYIEKLTAPFIDRIYTNLPIAEIERYPDHVKIVTANNDDLRYDKVIIATHSDQALKMLKDPSPLERQVLSDIAYQPNEAVLHTDTALLPKRRAVWSAWNYHIHDDDNAGNVSLTYNMNILQSLSCDKTYCVTLNNSAAIDPDKIIRKIQYHHPVFNDKAIQAQARWSDISGVNRTYYCGAYWGYGFHEDGVKSALRTIKLFEEQQFNEELYLRRAY